MSKLFSTIALQELGCMGTTIEYMCDDHRVYVYLPLTIVSFNFPQ